MIKRRTKFENYDNVSILNFRPRQYELIGSVVYIQAGEESEEKPIEGVLVKIEELKDHSEITTKMDGTFRY
jgi:hypothetical protein